jgi:hypothetical protein
MFKLVLRYASLQRKARTCITCARSPTAAHRLLRFCHAIGGIDDKEALEEVETCPFDPFALSLGATKMTTRYGAAHPRTSQTHRTHQNQRRTN